jgi:ATP-binding cassette, subfamily B, vacuolar membrane transporter HMT1/ACLQ
MAFSFSPVAGSSSASSPAVNHLLVYIRFLSPIILLAVFLVAFTVHSVVTASKDINVKSSTQATGPGGKPLPQKASALAKAEQAKRTEELSPARKLLFLWLSVGTTVTFVGNAVLVILHTVIARKENWWCGESVAV